MKTRHIPWLAASLLVLASLGTPGVASAHARVDPPISLARELQLYSLVVPTEKDHLTTTKVVLTVPSGFAIDSFAPAPSGWQRQVQQAGSGDGATITRVTWSGGRTPTGEDSVFQFLAQPAAARTYTFAVQQTYSDGSIVNWTGPESSDAPAPAIEARTALGGGGGSSTAAIVAIVLAAVALLLVIVALAGGRSGRELV